jgi:uncharacterized protein YjiS (DUF1127 family)
METIMSTISSAAVRRGNAASGLLAVAGAAIKRWWGAYIAWRVEQAAIAQLESMSDRDLKDIGLTRSEITGAVRGEAARDRACSRYY